MIYSKDEWDSMEKELRLGGKTLVSVATNLIDSIWVDRPPRSLQPVVHLSMEYAGKSTSKKLEEIRKELVDSGAEILIITQLDEVACK